MIKVFFDASVIIAAIISSKGASDVVSQKDAHVLAGAKLTDSNYLVSLDRKHIVKNEIKKKAEEIRIVLPKELLAKLRKISKLYN